MYTWYIHLLETESKGNNNLQEDLVPIVARLDIEFLRILTAKEVSLKVMTTLPTEGSKLFDPSILVC